MCFDLGINNPLHIATAHARTDSILLGIPYELTRGIAEYAAGLSPEQCLTLANITEEELSKFGLSMVDIRKLHAKYRSLYVCIAVTNLMHTDPVAYLKAIEHIDRSEAVTVYEE